jgi:hypothetical protein
VVCPEDSNTSPQEMFTCSGVTLSFAYLLLHCHCHTQHYCPQPPPPLTTTNHPHKPLLPLTTAVATTTTNTNHPTTTIKIPSVTTKTICHQQPPSPLTTIADYKYFWITTTTTTKLLLEIRNHVGKYLENPIILNTFFSLCFVISATGHD